MKKITSVKYALNTPSFNKSYCISLKNASKRTQGRDGDKLENNASASKYANHEPQVF